MLMFGAPLKWLARVGYIHLDPNSANPNPFYARLPAETNFKPEKPGLTSTLTESAKLSL